MGGGGKGGEGRVNDDVDIILGERLQRGEGRELRIWGKVIT